MLQGATVLGVAVGGWISDAVAARDARRRARRAGRQLPDRRTVPAAVSGPPFVWTDRGLRDGVSFFRGIGQASENPALCEVIPARFRSTAIGLMNTGATAAGGLGVLLAGYLKVSFGLAAVFAGIAASFVIAGAMMLLAAWRWAGDDIARASAAR
jgi:hypothetical protein